MEPCRGYKVFNKLVSAIKGDDTSLPTEVVNQISWRMLPLGSDESVDNKGTDIKPVQCAE